MAKLTFIYTVFCLMTVHLTFVLTEISDQGIQGVSKPSLLSNDHDNFYNQNPIQNYYANGKQSVGSKVIGTEDPKSQLAQNIDRQYETAILNNSRPNTKTESAVDNSQIELPQLFVDFESLKRSKDTALNNLMTTDHINQDTELTPVTSEPGNIVHDNENTPDDEIETSTSSYNDYDGNEGNEIDKKDQINGIPGIYDSEVDDDDEEYSVTKWAEHDNNDGDDYSDKDYEDENDEDDNGLDESKNLSATDDELPKRSKQPTAPTSMVLFYTWMIIAVIIIIVGISTYQSRCRNIRFPWKRAAVKPKDDHKRLIEHEFV